MGGLISCVDRSMSSVIELELGLEVEVAVWDLREGCGTEWKCEIVQSDSI